MLGRLSLTNHKLYRFGDHMNWIRSVLVHIFLSLISSIAFGIPDELSHQLSGNVKGKIIFHQMEGNSTHLRDSGKLASCIPTMVSFELSDPRHNLHSVTFIYTWDMGNGEVRKGSAPFLKYYYTIPGNYTLKLSIETNNPQHSRMTGLYSVYLTVLDAIRSIELRGPSTYNVDENSSLSFHFGGSPPVWMCWRFLSDCQTPSPASCNLVRVYGNIFNLNYTFTSAGTYCLDLSVRNNISNLQTSYDIYVQSSRFILPQFLHVVGIDINNIGQKPTRMQVYDQCVEFAQGFKAIDSAMEPVCGP